MRAALYDAAPEQFFAPQVIRYVECPHCHHEVMEKPDGQCIACGKNRFDTAGVDLHQTMVTIENISRLPTCCILCGEDTQRLQRFTWNYRISPYTLTPWMIPLVTLMSFLPGSEYRTTERLRLPVCPCCSKPARKLRPASVWSGLDCRLRVHRRFRERFEALNGKPRLEWEGDGRGTVQAKSQTVRFFGLGARLT